MSTDYLSVATKASNRHERSEQWRRLTHWDLVDLGEDREASLRGCDLGEMRACFVSIGEHQLEATGQVEKSKGDGLVKLLFIETGKVSVTQAEHTICVSAGQWCALDKTLPFTLASDVPTTQLAVAVPRRRIIRWEETRHRIAANRSYVTGTTSVLHCSVANAVNAATGLGRRDRKVLGEALIQLLNAAWHADPVCHSTRGSHARRLAVIDFVERNITDPDLDISRISQELGYAKRTLHKLFSDSNDTLGRLIWQKRLERCRRDLLDPAQARLSITEIAFAGGFNDSQHFSRAFKARYGTSPREYRSGHIPH